MRGVLRRPIVGLIAAVLYSATPSFTQQTPGAFHWADFHSPQDQSVVTWVTRALQGEKWTAIREIGVEWDAALVVTTQRANPQSPPNADTFSIWSVSLTNHMATPLLKGVNLRWLDWMRFAVGTPLEPAVLYDNCSECAADTYLTSFYYDISHHVWTARWMRGGQGLHLWSSNAPPGVAWTQVYAVMADDSGRELVGTWNHFEYGGKRPAEDSVYQYDLDPLSRLERIRLLSGREADAMKQRLCRAQDAVPGLARGQDTPLCAQYVKLQFERRPVTTPPANNKGQSRPPGARH
jgi:hypothetical protein